MNKSILSIIVLLLFGQLTLAQEAPATMEELIAKGLNAEKLELYDRAAGYYRQAIDAAPESAQPHLRLGLLMQRREHKDEAANELRTVIRLNDTLGEA